MSVNYEAANEEHEDRIRMILRMPDRHWFSIGFGSGMTNTDMIAWHANGAESYVKDYWSTSKS
jgi:phosphoserine aminotransferase